MKKDKDTKKIIIIGAGISGLSSGIYAEKNGFTTEIYEKNPLSGGLCTSWKRKNFLIDGCIHWLTGTKEGTEINELWHDTNAFNKEDIIFYDDFGTIDCLGTPITLWCDLDKLEKELIQISPEDKKLIKKFLKLVIAFQNMPLPIDIPISTMSIFRLIQVGCSMIPYLKDYILCTKTTMESYAKKYKSEKLRYLFEHVVPGRGNLYTMIYAFGTVAVGNGGVPKGGSRSIINNMTNYYNDLGGKINYNSEVKKIIIENKKAVGILLSSGEIKKADYIVTACDSIEVTEKLLNNEYSIHGFQKRVKHEKQYPTQSCVLITYAVDAQKLANLNLSHTYEFSCKPFYIANEYQYSIKMRHFLSDATFIKNNKVTINVLVTQSDQDYFYWDELNKNKAQYNKEKENIARVIAHRIAKKFPSLKESIEILDVVTPKTFNRYTNAYHGAYMPFAFTSKGYMFYYGGKVKGIKNLFVSGQWTMMPGGLPLALITGKWTIQRILKKEQKFFEITKRIKFTYTRLTIKKQ